jgi:hypothetical protein
VRSAPPGLATAHVGEGACTGPLLLFSVYKSSRAPPHSETLFKNSFQHRPFAQLCPDPSCAAARSLLIPCQVRPAVDLAAAENADGQRISHPAPSTLSICHPRFDALDYHDVGPFSGACRIGQDTSMSLVQSSLSSVAPSQSSRNSS